LWNKTLHKYYYNDLQGKQLKKCSTLINITESEGDFACVEGLGCIKAIGRREGKVMS
jgi:hypothetical protein